MHTPVNVSTSFCGRRISTSSGYKEVRSQQLVRKDRQIWGHTGSRAKDGGILTPSTPVWGAAWNPRELLLLVLPLASLDPLSQASFSFHSSVYSQGLQGFFSEMRVLERSISSSTTAQLPALPFKKYFCLVDPNSKKGVVKTQRAWMKNAFPLFSIRDVHNHQSGSRWPNSFPATNSFMQIRLIHKHFLAAC